MRGCRGGQEGSPLQNSNFYKLYYKITQNMLRTPRPRKLKPPDPTPPRKKISGSAYVIDIPVPNMNSFGFLRF